MTAQLSRERIMEMEEEMNRFEQEIAQPQAPRDCPSFGGSKMMMMPSEPEPPPATASAIQFIPHQLQHPGMSGPPQPEPQPVFMGQHFPPQNMMGPMQIPMGHGHGHGHGFGQPVIGPMPNQGFVPTPMGPQAFPGPGGPPGPIVITRPPGPPDPAIVTTATPTVYAAPPVKLVTVYQEPKTETTRALPPPPPIPAALKPEVRMDVPPAAVHKGVVGRPPEHSYEEPTTTTSKRSSSKKKKIIRLAGSQIWEDNSLLDWDLDDFRIFCGDLGNDVTDEILTRAFGRYPSFVKAKVVRDKRTNKTKGYGFVSFKDPQDFIKAMKEMNGKYVGSRPIKLRKSSWRDRNIEVVRKKQKEKEKLGLL